MDSNTKNRQASRVLKDMVARAYGDALVPEVHHSWCTELEGGWFSAAYRITLRDGRDVVLKIAPPAGTEVMTYERDAMRTELRALELIRGATSVPVPHVDHADLSHEVCDADYFFMQYIDADNLATITPDLPPERAKAYMVELGTINRRINAVTGPAFGPLTGEGDADWETAFLRMVDAVLDDGQRRSVELGIDYEAVRALVVRDRACLREVTEPRLVEWDLWPGNVMVARNRIVAVIDHERAFFGDPLVEAGFAGTQSTHFWDAESFMRGYGHPELTPMQARRRQLYQLHLALVMVIETAYRGYADPRPYEWARARLGESVERLAAPAETHTLG
jgi:aminoglycoside phosphotransferase (APT) family kinase protein